MSNLKETKQLFGGWRKFLTEAAGGNMDVSQGGEFDPIAPREGLELEGDETPATDTADAKIKTVHVYDFDGVIATFSQDLKDKFYSKSKEQGSTITGTEIQIKNTLALGAALLATAESCGDNYEMLHTPVAPYFIITKFTNPSYVLQLKYYEELRTFLEASGLDLRTAPNGNSSKKATVIKHFLSKAGAPAPEQILVSENVKTDSKLIKAEAIPGKFRGQQVRYMIHSADTADGVKEAKMIKSGLVNAGADENRIEFQFFRKE
jgi:hypothetical protein